MSDGLQAALGVAAIVLAALLVGALLPVLFEARATLRRARRILTEAGPRLGTTLAEASTVLAKLDRVASDTQKILSVATALGAAVGPAVAGAVKGYQAARRNGHGADTPETPGEALEPRGAHEGG